ncbi:MAG: hypothetical protein AAGI01_16665 [Myxococcota bacterium]
MSAWLDAILESCSARDLGHVAEALERRYDDLTDPVSLLSKRMLQRLRLVAHGPRGALLFVERHDPRHVIVALHHALPPLMWLPAGRTIEEVRGVVDAHHRDPEPILSLPRTHRGLVMIHGLERELVVRIVHQHPLLSSRFWGARYDEDPWLDAPPNSPPDAFMEQRAGAAWSLGCRSVLSGSSFVVQDHDGLFVLALRYASAGHGELLSALSAHAGVALPEDLPLDVASLLLEFGVLGPRELVSMLAGPDTRELALYALGAVKADDLTLVEDLRPWSAHASAQVRRTVADVCVRHGLEPLLIQMAAREKDRELRDALWSRL